ncbi:uncharacterized protein YukE [Actinoplanes octamycinicus]|uniref:Uncharacterized protein YukE n=1 Tax=Actinoplanes octamycinicus TaxID=135948 RepID=A0A7W7M8F8_9ACTN|nr:type VII secretion target [Actinoplanes octamycinicus]MBB4740775.1 uncharacterized protein YukE [Actinoplanes octamycinicus]
MTFHVVPGALRQYAAELTDGSGVAEETRGYADRWGSFTPHESGILGELTRRHTRFLTDLDETLTKLALILDTSARNMDNVAAAYEHTDARSAAEIDAGYPPAQRPITSAGS